MLACHLLLALLLIHLWLKCAKGDGGSVGQDGALHADVYVRHVLPLRCRGESQRAEKSQFGHGIVNQQTRCNPVSKFRTFVRVKERADTAIAWCVNRVRVFPSFRNARARIASLAHVLATKLIHKDTCLSSDLASACFKKTFGFHLKSNCRVGPIWLRTLCSKHAWLLTVESQDPQRVWRLHTGTARAATGRAQGE